MGSRWVHWEQSVWNCCKSWSRASISLASLSTPRIPLPSPRSKRLHKLGIELLLQNASSERDIEAAFANFLQQHTNAVMVGADAFFLSRRDQLVGLTARHAMPAIYYLREFAVAGGLISYGASISDAFRIAGGYVGRIL